LLSPVRHERGYLEHFGVPQSEVNTSEARFVGRGELKKLLSEHPLVGISLRIAEWQERSLCIAGPSFRLVDQAARLLSASGTEGLLGERVEESRPAATAPRWSSLSTCSASRRSATWTIRNSDRCARVGARWKLRCRAVADNLEEAGARLFTFLRYPPEQWRSLGTTDEIERLHEEFKRRIKTQCLLPCAETAAMLFWALLAAG
jgi:hypothetical protein